MKPITPEESIDKNYYLPSVIESANQYIPIINKNIFFNSKSGENILEHNFSIEPNPSDKYLFYCKEIMDYVKIIYEKEKWIVSYDFQTEQLSSYTVSYVNFKISHPKSIFK